MPVEENPYFQRFNDAIVPASASSFSWRSNERASSQVDGGADARIKRQSRPYWVTDLSGLRLNQDQSDELQAMLWRNGGSGRPVLMRIAIFCEIGTIVGRETNGYPIVTPAFLGTGTGTLQQFQLRKRLLVAGYESEQHYFNVTKPHIDYPDMKAIGSTLAGPIAWAPMPEITVYDDGVELSRTFWTVDRNTGVVEVTATGTLTVSGGFYIPMLLPDEIPTGYDEGARGLLVIKSGVRLEEPPGSEYEVPE